MRISLAQALKEKNRLASEIMRGWQAIARENSKREDIARVIDVAQMRERVELYTEKLVELKRKIGQANAGNLERIYRMDECKNQLRQLGGICTDETPIIQRLSDKECREYKRTVVFTAAEIWAWQERLQQECNRLQDEMDIYNATTHIEFETPLAR